MVLRIEECPFGPRIRLVLSGRIESSNVEQLTLQIDRSERGVTLDLRQVRIVDRDAVRFLARCEMRGVELLDCPPFVRAWIKSEQSNEGEEMSRVPVETPTLPEYAPVPRSALGPALNEQGYYVGRVERNLYWVTDSVYQAAFLTTKDGVVLFDAPPTIGNNLQRAIDEIAKANSVSNKVTHMIYSHHHADHIGASSLFGKNVVRIGHEEARRLLLRDNDPARPAPDETFNDRRVLEIGGERIELAWHGPAHTPDTIYIHLPKHDTLMLVDIILPGWAPFVSFNNAEDVPGCIAAPGIALSYPWRHFIGGHIGRIGTREDLILQQEHVDDIVTSIKTALGTVNPVPYFQKYGENVWGGVKQYLDAVANAAAAPVIKKYTGVLAAADVYTFSTVFLIMESLRLDLGFGSQVHP